MKSADDNATLQRNASFLREMGLPVLWQARRSAAPAASTFDDAVPETAPESAAAVQTEALSHQLQEAASAGAEMSGQTVQQALAQAPADMVATPAAMLPSGSPESAVPANPGAAWDEDAAGAPAQTSPQQAMRTAEASFLPSSAAQDFQHAMHLAQTEFSEIAQGAHAMHDEQGDPRAAAIAAMDWAQLEQAVAQCTACNLCRGRKQAVFGVGDRRAQWLLVGEGPGRTEDAVGEPFVGKSGKLLDNMLASIDLQRGKNVYIANIVKCRPTDASGNDRPPSEQEAAACRPFLERQITLIAPKLMLALGKTAAISLLGAGPQTTISSLRGKRQQFQGKHLSLPLVASYHPAYLLRKPADKARAWADLCLAQSCLPNDGANVVDTDER